ncbi:MAG: uroporphyrinogen-III synthase [marine bacterium B5-7]|nr:MAG: uroporphyrinogen-III synthase [marine bacterium B5-7]
MQSDIPGRDSLASATILVTRPKAQAARLVTLVEQCGGQAVVLPLIDIVAAPQSIELDRLLNEINRFDILIFVSRNAVDHGMMLMRRLVATPSPRAIILAVGSATAAALENLDFKNVIRPEGRSNSEELLKCEALKHVAGRSVLIFRGQEGRELIADSLRRRGAVVEYASVYQRVATHLDIRISLKAWLKCDQPMLVLTSAAAAEVLMERTPEDLATQMRRIPLVVFSERLGERLRHAGWKGPIGVSERTSDAGIVATLGALHQLNLKHMS